MRDWGILISINLLLIEPTGLVGGGGLISSVEGCAKFASTTEKKLEKQFQ